MSDDKPEKKTAARPAYATLFNGPAGARPIPVAILKFRNGVTYDFPKKPVATAIGDDRFEQSKDTGQWSAKSQEQVNKPRYRIVYLPWAGLHAVTFYPAGEVRPFGSPVFIPREWASWEPAPEHDLE